jgi:hypothetical protein
MALGTPVIGSLLDLAGPNRIDWLQSPSHKNTADVANLN